METKPTFNPYHLTDKEAMALVERMINGCMQFSEKKISFQQLWYRCRGDRLCYAIQMAIHERELGYLLYQLYMDFISWRGDKDELIAQSALQVAAWAKRRTSLPA